MTARFSGLEYRGEAFRVQQMFGPGFQLFGRRLPDALFDPLRQRPEAAGQLPAQQRDFALGYSLLKPLLQSLLKSFPLPLFGSFDNAFGEHGIDLL
ncbi:hypothetical protein [Methylococcus capsulatus]|uniref:Uncharacterized protein n=1 Tax=Methylococcus capsulatus TaxID=414 RepID=A0ABZ2F411_METCP|nr:MULTISPECIES: hypothetical protein [Methylococcus]